MNRLYQDNRSGSFDLRGLSIFINDIANNYRIAIFAVIEAGASIYNHFISVILRVKLCSAALSL